MEWPNGAMERGRYGCDSAVGWKGMVMLSGSDALWSFCLRWVVKVRASTLTGHMGCWFGKS